MHTRKGLRRIVKNPATCKNSSQIFTKQSTWKQINKPKTKRLNYPRKRIHSFSILLHIYCPYLWQCVEYHMFVYEVIICWSWNQCFQVKPEFPLSPVNNIMARKQRKFWIKLGLLLPKIAFLLRKHKQQLCLNLLIKRIQLFRERLSEKMCTQQSRKVTWDMINTLFLMIAAVEFICVAFL